MSALARRNVIRQPIAVAEGEVPDLSRAETKQGLDPQLQHLIGDRLRSYYSELLSEPVPDRFLDLLKGFDAPKRRH